MGAGLSGGAIVVVLLIGMAVYGGSAVIHGIGHVFKKTAQVTTHPIRHPKKDAKAVYHKLSGDRPTPPPAGAGTK